MKVVIGSTVWRTVEVRHVSSLVNILRQPGFAWAPQHGDALVERARSINATWFLNHTDADVHLSIDSDITDFSLEDVTKVCEQAMTHDIVCGLYVTRGGHGRTFPTSRVEEGRDILMDGKNNELVPLVWGATGFMATHRRVFERLSQDLPLLHRSDGDRAFYPFYVPFWVDWQDDQILLSEDYAFCQRAKDAGFGVWLNPAVRLGHIGQYAYRLEDMATEFPDPQPLVIRCEGRTWSVKAPEPIAAAAVPL